MDKLFDEDLLLGNGWTVRETLRPLAYSTIADLVHHVRQHLTIDVLVQAVHLFAKNVHDETLPTSIQTMSCKLLLNLVDCIRLRSETDSCTSRDLLITMLNVFTKKFHTIAKIQLPQILAKWAKLRESQAGQLAITAGPSSAAATAASGASGLGIAGTGPPVGSMTPAAQAAESTSQRAEQLGIGLSSDPSGSVSGSGSSSEANSRMSKIGIPPPTNHNIIEYRSLVKTLVCGVKTITWGCASCKSKLAGDNVAAAKLFQPQEIVIFVDLVHWALEALDIYTIVVPPGPAKPPGQLPRSKEEKEVLEHFSGVVSRKYEIPLA